MVSLLQKFCQEKVISDISGPTHKNPGLEKNTEGVNSVLETNLGLIAPNIPETTQKNPEEEKELSKSPTQEKQNEDAIEKNSNVEVAKN